MSKEIAALGLATMLALFGVVLPPNDPIFDGESNPVEEEVDKLDEPGIGDDSIPYPSSPFTIVHATHRSSRTAVGFDSDREQRAGAVAKMHNLASQARLPKETIEKLGEISQELAEDYFDEDAKEKAIADALDALLKSLHASRKASTDTGYIP